MIKQTQLTIWVVYNSPIDFPGFFVARKWVGEEPTSELVRGATLEEVRGKLPGGLYKLNRHEADDPKIIETWIY